MKRFLFTALLALFLAFPAMAQDYGGSQTQTQQQTTQQPATGTQEEMGTTEGQLPASASPLPLVGLAGLVSLAAGYWLGRRRK